MANRGNRVDVEIAAKVEGRESVTDLARRLDDVAKVLEGDVKEQAQQAARELRGLGEQQEAIQAFERLKRQSTEAGAALKALEDEAANYGKQVGAAGPPTVQQAEHLARLEAEARATREELARQKEALAAAGGELNRYGISTRNTQAAEQRLAQEADRVRDRVQAIAPAYQSTAAAAQAAGRKQQNANKQAANSLDDISAQLKLVQALYLAFAGGNQATALIGDLAATADAYNSLAARIKLTTGEGAAFESAMAGVQRIAVATRSDLEATGTLFTKIYEAGRQLNMSQEQALSLTQTINQAIQVSGGSAESAKAAITQLVQGLQGGVLRGDEFNSVMEQSPRLAKALADGLGVTTGELRKLAEAGRLSSETVITALRSQGDVVASEFSKLPPTVGAALQNLSTAWTVYVGNADKATGASLAAAEAINYLSQNLETIVGVLLDVGQAGAAFVALRLAQHFLDLGKAAKVAAVETAASATAIQAAGNAGAAAAAGVGRFATILATLRTFTLLGLITNFKDIGTWIGEATANLVLWVQGKENAEQAAKRLTDEENRYKAAIEGGNKVRERGIELARATEAAHFALSKRALELIADYDELRDKGERADEAIAKIGQKFDLSNQPGIRDAVAVLDKLVAAGKLSASQFEAAWAQALQGQDLLQFEVTARAALAGTAREAERLAQITEATLRESIRRTGLDFDVISGGMSKASVSAINDLDRITGSLDVLRARGVDVSGVLQASLQKAFNTADSQAAVDGLKLRVESLRKLLGDDVTNNFLAGLEERARGLNRALAETEQAFERMGVTSRARLADMARQASQDYETIKRSGQATATDLQTAWARMTEAQIRANGGVVTAMQRAQAQMRGLEVSTDASGRVMVRAMNEAADATRGVGNAADSAAQSFAEMESAAASASKAASSASSGGSAASTGGGLNLTATYRNKSRAGTLSADDLPWLEQLLQLSGQSRSNTTGGALVTYTRDTINRDTLRQDIARLRAGTDAPAATLPQASGQPQSAPAPTPVHVHLAGGTQTVNVASAQDVQSLQTLLQQLGGAAGRAI